MRFPHKKAVCLLVESILILNLLAVLFNQAHALPTVDPIDLSGLTETRTKVNSTYARGAYWSVKYGGDGFEWRSEPSWIWSDSSQRYVPYILNDSFSSQGVIEVKAGLVGAKMFRGRVEYYDPSMSRLAVGRENWVVWERVGQDWRPIVASLQTYFDSASISENTDHLNITASWSTGKGTLSINYHFKERLKHSVVFTPNQAGVYAVTQIWNNTQYSDVELGNKTIIKRTDNVIIGSSDSLIFKFFNDTQPFGIFEDQSRAQDKFNRAIFAGGSVTYEGIRVTDAVAWIFSFWILGAGQPLTLDPDTATLEDPTTDAYVWYDDSSDDYTKVGGTLIKCGEGLGADDENKGYIEWNTSSIPDLAVITDTTLLYHGARNDVEQTFPVRSLPIRPSLMSAEELFYDIDSGSTVILSGQAVFPEVGANKSLDLGPIADSEVQSKLTSDFFAIGFDCGSNFEEHIYAEDYGSADPPPTLVITYKTPTSLSFSVSSDSVYSGQTITLSATLTGNSTGLSNKTITFQRSEDNSTWSNVINKTSDSNGDAEVDYGQTETGTWYLRASFNESDLYSPSNSDSLSVEYLPGGPGDGDDGDGSPPDQDGSDGGCCPNPIGDVLPDVPDFLKDVVPEPAIAWPLLLIMIISVVWISVQGARSKGGRS